MKRRALMTMLVGGALIFNSPTSSAQAYPAKPIRIIVGYAPGAQSDAIARLVAHKLAAVLGVAVIVENRPGANGTIGVETVARSAADGYTLGLAGGGSLTVAPALDGNVRFDAQRDFVLLARIARVPLVLVARSDLPVKTAAQLLDFARKNPGKLTYASGGASAQMAIESLKVAASLDIVTVPYKGTAPALLDVVAGRVDLILADVAAAAPHIRSGRLHMIGNAGSGRARAFPDVPTIDEQGLSDFVWESWQGIVMPMGAPAEVVATLQSALWKVRSSADLQEGLERLGFEPIDEGPEVFSAVVRGESERFRQLVRRVGMRVN